MPLTLPNLDDRTYEQLLDEAKRRIPVHTPEWTTFNVESDPGITLVQLFAFLTDSLLYRANRIPERNRLKFLQLLGVPLQPATAAEGLVTIQNERGPLAALPLGAGVVVTAGSVNFLTRDPLTVLPLLAVPLYKQPIGSEDERHAGLLAQHEAALAAVAAVSGLAADGATPTPQFYETSEMTLPSVGAPDPVLDLTTTLDNALYLALLAPKNVAPDAVRDAIANTTLSIGVVPALSAAVDPLLPARATAEREAPPTLIYEIPDVAAPVAPRYRRLPQLRSSEVLTESGIVQLLLPDAAALRTWTFDEPFTEGTVDYPPLLEDDSLHSRLVTWLRLRLPQPADAAPEEVPLSARLSWVGVNATQVIQAVQVVNESLGQGTGEPDQQVTLANLPVLPASLHVEVQAADGSWAVWGQTDDLLAADLDDAVYTLDPEAGVIRFGSGINGRRPPAGRRLRASYEYGGGRGGNVAVGGINGTPDVRLQGGFKVSNPIPTSGGDRGETVAEGERAIPLYLRHRDRLVTEEDIRNITLRAAGVDVGRVDVLPQFYPPEPEQVRPGVITVLVIPEEDPIQPLWPIPDRLFLRRVCSYLDSRRLITTEIHVRAPIYVDVHLSLGIVVREGHYRDQVVADVRERMRSYLSALPPGGPDEAGWPRNRPLRKQELEAEAARVSGVSYVDSLYLGQGTSYDLDEVTTLTGLRLPRLATVEVRVGEAEELDQILEAPPADGGANEQFVPIPVTDEVC